MRARATEFMVPNNRLSVTDTTALDDFTRRLRAALGEQIVEMRLFGSKARGDAGPDADYRRARRGRRSGSVAVVTNRQRR
jgi:hypothetical protein